MSRKTIKTYLLLTLVIQLGSSLISATYVMFLIARGLNLFEVNLVNFIFFATLAISEIPTGVIADVFGRKASFVCFCLLFSLSAFIYAGSYSIFWFMFVEAIAAVGRAFASGAFQAWLVDRLKYYEYSGALNSIFAKAEQISHGSGIVGAIIGAFLASKNIALPWIAMGCIMFIAAALALFLMKEEYFVRQKLSLRGCLCSMRGIIQFSIGYGVKNKVVRFIFLMGIIQFFAIQAANMQWQPFFSQFFVDNTNLGFIFAGISICLIIGSALSPWFLKLVRSEKRALVISQIIIGAGIFSAAILNLLPLIILAFFIHEAGRGLFRPLKDAYLNDNIPSKERATLISIESMSHHIGGMIGLLFSGFIAEYVSISAAWIISGVFLMAATLLLAKNSKD